MSINRTPEREGRWSLVAIGITILLVLVTAATGLILLPLLQANVSYASLWDKICSAAGALRPPSNEAPVESSFKTSQVVLTSGMLSNPGQESIGRGATLAHRCAICHGPTGVSRTDSPNLAGQYASAIYKELLDFRSGARVNSVMSPFADGLRSGYRRYYRLLFLPSTPARLSSGDTNPSAADCDQWRADARHCVLRIVSRQSR